MGGGGGGSSGPSHTGYGSSYTDIDRVREIVAATVVRLGQSQSLTVIRLEGRQQNVLTLDGRKVYERGKVVYDRVRQTTTWQTWSDGSHRAHSTTEAVIEAAYRSEYT